MKNKKDTLKQIVHSFYVQFSKILIYIALHIFMIGLIIGGCYLTVITLLEDYMSCLEFTLGGLMTILGVVMIYTFIKDVVKE